MSPFGGPDGPFAVCDVYVELVNFINIFENRRKSFRFEKKTFFYRNLYSFSIKNQDFGLQNSIKIQNKSINPLVWKRKSVFSNGSFFVFLERTEDMGLKIVNFYIFLVVWKGTL